MYGMRWSGDRERMKSTATEPAAAAGHVCLDSGVYGDHWPLRRGVGDKRGSRCLSFGKSGLWLGLEYQSVSQTESKRRFVVCACWMAELTGNVLFQKERKKKKTGRNCRLPAMSDQSGT